MQDIFWEGRQTSTLFTHTQTLNLNEYFNLKYVLVEVNVCVKILCNSLIFVCLFLYVTTANYVHWIKLNNNSKKKKMQFCYETYFIEKDDTSSFLLTNSTFWYLLEKYMLMSFEYKGKINLPCSGLLSSRWTQKCRKNIPPLFLRLYCGYSACKWKLISTNLLFLRHLSVSLFSAWWTVTLTPLLHCAIPLASYTLPCYQKSSSYTLSRFSFWIIN